MEKDFKKYFDMIANNDDDYCTTMYRGKRIAIVDWDWFKSVAPEFKESPAIPQQPLCASGQEAKLPTIEELYAAIPLPENESEAAFFAAVNATQQEVIARRLAEERLISLADLPLAAKQFVLSFLELFYKVSNRRIEDLTIAGGCSPSSRVSVFIGTVAPDHIFNGGFNFPVMGGVDGIPHRNNSLLGDAVPRAPTVNETWAQLTQERLHRGKLHPGLFRSRGSSRSWKCSLSVNVIGINVFKLVSHRVQQIMTMC